MGRWAGWWVVSAGGGGTHARHARSHMTIDVRIPACIAGARSMLWRSPTAPRTRDQARMF